MARGSSSVAGFTLVEVLIAMAITALISVVAYREISARWSTDPSSMNLVKWCQRSWVVRWRVSRSR